MFERKLREQKVLKATDTKAQPTTFKIKKTVGTKETTVVKKQTVNRVSTKRNMKLTLLVVHIVLGSF